MNFLRKVNLIMAILFIPPKDWVPPKYTWVRGEQFRIQIMLLIKLLKIKKLIQPQDGELLIFDIYLQGFQFILFVQGMYT